LKESVFHLLLQNIVAPNIGQKLSSNQWPVILGSELYANYRGQRVLAVTTFNTTFLLLKCYCEKICTSFLNDAESLKTYGCALYAIGFMGVGRISSRGAKSGFFQAEPKIYFQGR